MTYLSNNKTSLIVLTCLLSVLFSCTPRKKLVYMQQNINTSATENTLQNYKLRTGDVLYVKVQTMDDKTHKLFNAEWSSNTQRSEMGLFIEGYVIDSDNTVTLPIVGKIIVGGLTIEEAHKIIQGKIDDYLLDASVIVKLINYKVTVLGEVSRPGTFKIYDSQINLLEAISLAGDLTVFGNRQNIKIVRRSDNNKVAVLDITDINVINNEFFVLKPHDVVYIEPLKAKTLGFKEFPFSILFSSITTIIVLINFFK